MSVSRRPAMTTLVAVLASTGLALGDAPRARAQSGAPETATQLTSQVEAKATKTMVVTANPLATRAAARILAEGGNAIDAAITASLVLGLVEPQASGLGGGGLMLAYDGKTHQIRTFDGRETAPANTGPDHFLGPDGKTVAFIQAIASSRVVGVPGLLRLLETAHKAHGHLPWARLFQPAIDLAEAGFPVPNRMGSALTTYRKSFEPFAPFKAVFFDQAGEPYAVGATFRNPAYAATLRDVAAHGPDAFYTGPRAQRIVDAVAKAIDSGPAPIAARISTADLANYRAKERPVLCAPYHGHRVCTMGPPSAGGIEVLEILGELETYDLRRLAPDDVYADHLILEASRRAFVDRETYVGDPDRVSVPAAGLIDRAYVQTRAMTIDPATVVSQKVAPGVPPGLDAPKAPGLNGPQPSTSHIAIIDAAGNVVSMTQSIDISFGSRIVTDGFVLNNHLTDFSFVPEKEGRQVPNAPGPGKRPRSSMAPTIVTDAEGRFEIAVGSAGGSAIPGFVAKTLIAHLDWGMGAQAAVNWPIMLNRNGDTEIEANTPLAALKPQLEALGHHVRLTTMIAGTNMIIRDKDGTLTGASDPRREGMALGSD